MAFYNGTGKKISGAEIKAIAGEFGYEEAMVRAFMEVEARSSGFYADGTVLALYEPHKAYIYGSKVRAALVSAGLAYKSWGEKPYPASSYPRIKQCCSIAGDEVAALSTSWGLGQVMGFNATTIGYKNAVEMVASFAQSEANQLRGSMKFIKSSSKGDTAMKTKSFKGLASFYNGTGYAKNGYHLKLEKAYNKWRAYTNNLDTTFSNLLPTDPVRDVMMKGDKGPEVKRLQDMLVAAGYPLENVDGDFGNMTVQAVKQFQDDQNLTQDGKVGPATYARLEKIWDEKHPPQSNTPASLLNDAAVGENADSETDNTYVAAPSTSTAGVVEALAQIVKAMFTKKKDVA